MNSFVVYILKSEFNGIHYTGYTSNLIARIKSHNSLSSKGFTKKYRPWTVIYLEFFTEEKNARSREKFLKTGAGRRWLSQNVFLSGG